MKKDVSIAKTLFEENLTEVSIDDQLSLGHPPLNFSGPPPYTIKHRLLESQTGNSNITIKKVKIDARISAKIDKNYFVSFLKERWTIQLVTD